MKTAINQAIRVGKAKDAFNADFATFAGDTQNAQAADKLDGKDSTDFVNSAFGTAPNANNLDGKDSTRFFSGETYKKFGSTPGSGGNSVTFASAFCDPGDVVLSGGAFTLDRSEDTLVQSNPTSVPSEGWTVAYRNGGGGNQVEASVVCADFPPLR